MGFFKKYFFNKDELTPREYTYSKVGFTISDAAAGCSSSIAGGSYVAAFLAFLGAGEAKSNFIMSLIVFAGFFQFLVPLITKNMTHKKPFIIFCYFFERLCMGLMFLTPFIFGIGELCIVATAILLAIAYTLANVVNSLHQEWFIKCIQPGGKIGSFCGLKDGIGNACLIVSFFALAMITKHFSGDKELYCYMWLGIIGLALCVIRTAPMIFVKEPYVPLKNDEKSTGLIETFKTIFTYKKLRPYLTYNFFSYFGIYLVSSLASILYVQRLKLPLEMLSYVMVLDLLLKTILAPVFGKIADKIGAKKVIAAGFAVLGISYLLNSFMTTDNAYAMRIIVAVLSAFGGSMTSAPAFSFMIESTPDQNRSSIIACMSSLFFLEGYLASLLATWFISAAAGFSITVLGFEFSEMALVFVVGSIFMFVAAISIIIKAKYHISKNSDNC